MIDDPPAWTTSSTDDRENAEAFMEELRFLALRLKQVAGMIESDALTPAARAVLECLHRHGPQTVPQLARAQGTSRQNVQIIVNRLSMERYVRFDPNPAHKRSELASITSEGVALLGESPNPQQRLAARVAQSIPPDELEKGKQLFKRMSSLLSELKNSGIPKEQEPAQATDREAKFMSGFATQYDNELPLNLL